MNTDSKQDSTLTSKESIRTRSFTTCVLCGAEGEPLHSGMKDRLYDAPGVWNLKRCPNRECGLVWMDPMPTAEDLSKAYECYYTHSASASSKLHRICGAIETGYLRSRMRYRGGVGPAWRGLLWPLAYLHWFGVTAARSSAMYLPVPADRNKLLEIGFGDGAALARMRNLGWDVEGVDTDPKAVDAAKSIGLSVRCGSVIDQRYADASYDCVTMRHALEHIPNPVEFLAECLRILKPGGKLVTIVPNISGLGAKWFGSSWYHLDPPRHLFMYDSCSLKKMAKSVGFEVDRIFSTPQHAWSIWIGSMIIRSPRHWMAGSVPRKVLSAAFQVFERATLIFNKQAGEEIVLIANKPGNQGE